MSFKCLKQHEQNVYKMHVNFWEMYIVELQIYYEECIQNGRVKTYPLGIDELML